MHKDQKSSARKSLLAGSITGVVQIAANSVLVAITIPVFINKLGVETYGVFALITVLGYFNVAANLGFSTSLIKHLAEQGRKLESNFDIVATSVMMSMLVFPIAVAAIVGTDFVMKSLLQVPDRLINQASRQCFVFLVMSNVLILLGQIPSAVLDALQKVYLTNGIQMLYNILNRGVVLLILIVAPSLNHIGFGVFVATVIWWVVLMVAAAGSWKFFEIEGLKSNLHRVARKHLAYGSKIYFSSILGFLYEPASKLLLSRFIGLNEVVYFDIGLRVKSFVWSIFERILYPFVPYMASVRDSSRVKMLVNDVEEKLLILIVVGLVTTGFVAHPLISLWIGKNVDVIADTTRVITMGFLMALTFLPFYQYLMVKNLPEKTIVLQGANVVVNASLFFVLVPFLGFSGALIAFASSLGTSTTMCVYYQWKYFRNSPFVSVKHVVKLLILGLMLTILDILVSYILPNPLARLLLLPVMNCAVAMAIVRNLGFIHYEDIELYFGSREGSFARLGKTLVRGKEQP